MINAVGREIDDELLEKYHLSTFSGQYARDGYCYQKAAPKAVAQNRPAESKVLPSIVDALRKCGIRDGMTLSFHHHFRDGDYVINMVMEAVASLGIKDISICCSSLGTAQAPIVPYIEDGTITGISTSGIRAEIGEAISHGKLKNPAFIRSHGGRVRAIECGDVKIDIAFIGAPTSDCYGNARGKGGKSDCGVLSYSVVDARYAARTVVITDTLMEAPNMPASIQGIDVDYVVVVDQIGNPNKIANELLRFTEDPRELIIARYTAEAMAATPYFRDGFNFQTGGGGPSLAATRFLKPYMDEKNVKMGFCMGGVTRPELELLKEGYIRTILDAQDFDLASVRSVNETPGHYEISTSQYANPLNKGAFVNQLDFVILGALEIDVHFNVNVVTGSDGILRGAPGGHPDTAAGAKCTIIVAPLLRTRNVTVCDEVLTVTTPGESVDMLVTEYGIAVNPRRPELLEALKKTTLPLMTIEELRDIAYSIAGKPEPVEFGDRVVALIEYRDGTIIDTVRQMDS